MATTPTQISDLWTPAIWVKEIFERQATFPAFMNSGAVLKTGLFDQIATGAGVTANIPFFKDVSDQDDEIQVEDTAPGTQVRTSGLMIAPILNRVCKTASSALAAQVSGADPVAAITASLAARRMKQRNKTMVSLLRGAFGSAVAAGSANAASLNALCNRVQTENGTAATSDNLMSVDLWINTKALMGELQADLQGGGMFVHPNVLAALERQDVTAFKEKSMGAFTIRTYRDVPIFVSESLARAGGTSGYVYDTYLLANGTIAYGEKPQAGDTVDVASLQLFIDRDKNNWSIWDRTRFVAALNGLKWVGTAGGQSATNAELAAVANWQLQYQTANRCGGVCMVTNG